ncbi:Zinc finger C2H2-type [Sesbania bispinosa]|nr:Zinc finger C2H2-type [Sesbania bispinosa]
MQVLEELVVSKDHTQIIKGKRTKRQRLPSMPSKSEEEEERLDLATTSPTTIELKGKIEEEEEYMANCLILLAQGHHAPPDHKSSGLCLYECKTCNRCFPSFQALGGHRASHKKPKANGNCTEEKKAVTAFVNDDHYGPTINTILSLQLTNRGSYTATTTAAITKSKVHECSICGAEFSSGQALGGHMRRHRTHVTTSTTTSSMSGGSPESQEAKKPRNVLKLDLNLPAPEDDHKFSFQPGPRENVIVFSTSSLVDCHY